MVKGIFEFQSRSIFVFCFPDESLPLNAGIKCTIRLRSEYVGILHCEVFFPTISLFPGPQV